MTYKIRTSGKSSTGSYIPVLTIPKEIAVLFDNTNFTVEKSGASIIYTSGGSVVITKKELEKYNYEDCRVKEIKND